MAALTPAQSRDIFNVIDAALVEILKAESTVTDVVGTNQKSGKGPMIESKLRNKPRDFANGELPALTVMTTDGSDADNEANGALRLIEDSLSVQIFVLTRGGDLGEITVLNKKVAAITAAFLRKQLHSSSELIAALTTPGNAPDAIIKNIFTTFSPTGEGQSRFEVVGTMTMELLVDICVEVP